jgi:hypothetical protein
VNVSLNIIVFCVLADVDEAAAWPDDAVAEPAHIGVALLVRPGERQERQFDAATVVEVELVGLIDHGRVVACRPRLVAGRRRAADQPLLIRDHHVVKLGFFRGDRGDAGRNARGEIADGIGKQFQAGAAGDDLERRERQRRDLRQRHLQLARIGEIGAEKNA